MKVQVLVNSYFTAVPCRVAVLISSRIAAAGLQAFFGAPVAGDAAARSTGSNAADGAGSGGGGGSATAAWAQQLEWFAWSFWNWALGCATASGSGVTGAGAGMDGAPAPASGGTGNSGSNSEMLQLCSVLAATAGQLLSLLPAPQPAKALASRKVCAGVPMCRANANP